MISNKNISSAYFALPDNVKDTPFRKSEALSRMFGQEIWLKHETHTPVASFKARGTEWWVTNNNFNHDRIVCVSAGNFGQAVAYSCCRRGIKVDVFTVDHTNPIKVKAIQSLGATVHKAGSTYALADLAAKKFAQEIDAYFLIDGVVNEITEGAGTIGLEITQQKVNLDIIYIPVGDGALINGIGSWIKQNLSKVKILGVCAQGASAMYDSWQNGEIINHETTSTIADGLAIDRPEPLAFENMLKVVDDITCVSDEEIIDSMKLLFQMENLIVEPSAAVGVAAIKRTASNSREKIATILTGSNIDPFVLKS